MPIAHKPFEWTEHLRRTIFLGRPAYFNAKDLNKEFEKTQRFYDELCDVVGAVSTLRFSAVVNEAVSSGVVTRTIALSYTGGEVFVRGAKFEISAGGINKVVTFPVPPAGKQYPPTYVVLKIDLGYWTYAEKPDLCGITATELPSSVRSVDVETYENPEIMVVQSVNEVIGSVRVHLATIYPRYDEGGNRIGFGVFYNAHRRRGVVAKQGFKVEEREYEGLGSLAERVEELVRFKLDKLLNERQLVRRFNLADVASAEYVRQNIGFSELVNRRQLVRDENLRDLPNPANARYFLGLGNVATQNFGNGENDVLRGNQLPVGLIAMWSGSASNIPQNWALCDGSNGTPDLRGRFIVGFSSIDTDYNQIGKTGGEKMHTLTIAEMPKHDHGGKTGEVSRRFASDTFTGHNTGNTSVGFGFGTVVHDHTIAEEGGGQAHENRPPYYVLAYIMYLGRQEDPPPPPVVQPTLSYPNFSGPTGISSGGYTNDSGVVVYDGDTVSDGGDT